MFPLSPVLSVTLVLLAGVWVGSGVVQEDGGVLDEAYSIWGNDCHNPWGLPAAESNCGAGQMRD